MEEQQESTEKPTSEVAAKATPSTVPVPAKSAITKPSDAEIAQMREWLGINSLEARLKKRIAYL